MTEFTSQDVQIQTPADCSAKSLEDFKDMVRTGGQVNEATLTALVATAAALAFVYNPKQELIGVGALKAPNDGYRSGVFKRAGVEGPQKFPTELGWIAVKEGHANRKMASAIVQRLVERLAGAPAYATSHASRVRMHSALTHAGFEKVGHPYPSSEADDTVYLFVRDA